VAEPTAQERDLLAQLVEDGWPIAVIAPRDDAEIEQFQHVARSLLRKGLVGVYGRPNDSTDIPLSEAEAIIADTDRWGTWMIAATQAGARLVQA
jgi:endonuclease YncB( thermonuclease family)